MSFSIDGHVLGIDLGGSKLRAALIDRTGGAVAELTEPTIDGDARAVVAQLGELGRRLSGETRLAGVGVGVPGVLVRGALQMAPNLPPFDGLDLARELEAELDAAVVVDNDVNMATLGECRHGLGVGVDDFVFIAIGTGVGMGIVSGGRLLRGARGAAGEIGELALDGRALEDVAGGLVVAAAAGASSAHDVFAAAERGDAAAAAVLARQADAIAAMVRIVQAVLDPAVVVFGGGIGSRDDFVAQVGERVGDGELRIERSALGERAGVVGAAEAAREHVHA